MAWWQFWRERPLGLKPAEDQFWQAYYGHDSWAGEPVNAHGAMQLSAFWACARLYCQTVATLSLGVYERAANGDKVLVADHPLYSLLHDSPNDDDTAVEFWEGRVLGLCTTGNGYAEKRTTAAGRTIALLRMPADTVVGRNSNGDLQYRFNDRGQEETLPKDKVFHIRGFGGGDCGLSPVTYARQTLGIVTATERQAAEMFSKGMRSRGFFVTPPNVKLNPEQREEAQRNLVDRFSGRDAPLAGILEGGVSWVPSAMSAKDAEMIMSRNFNVEDVCRWLGVPPVLIGHASQGQTMWGSGIEQIMLGWLTLGLRPYLTRIEQAVKKRVLTTQDRARGLFAEFNVDTLLRGDSAARAELLSKMVQNGSLMPAEWRRMENRPFVEGSDKLLINSTLVPLDQAGRKLPVPETEQ